MDGFQAGIQALLQDINANYGDDGRQQLPPPYPKLDSAAYQPKIARSVIPRQTQQQLSTALPTRPIETLYHDALESTSLNNIDRALSAESVRPPSWQPNRFDGAPAGGLALRGRTAPFSPTNAFPHEGPQLEHPIVPSPQDFRLPSAPYVQTQPTQMDVSSPPNLPLSSPSFRIKQRQIIKSFRPPANQATVTSSNRLLSHDRFSNTRKRNFQASKDDPLSPHPSSSSPAIPPPQPQIELNHAPPTVHGVQLVSLNEMPDRLRSVFHYPLFNAIQSRCFQPAYKSNVNLVVSAPTGGGKTAILEMAICRLASGFETDQYKVIYMAPTKSLCSERQRDWQARFAALDLQCAELTGDTEHGHLRSVQSASIVITTPEKWDSMTRKWKDYARLMHMVKLFLIDEVHILKDKRGATLEAVVSRMKSVGSNVRFVALSATVPNSGDVAKWLGKDPTHQHVPAVREIFGEDFRPVKLQKHVIGIAYGGNDFGFEGACDAKLPGIIAKYSHKKPIIIFCITRSSTINTAKVLANLWASKSPRDRYWEGPTQKVDVQDPDLKNTLISSVAFHHAGLDSSDRHAIERGFLKGQINVICCTSTLAVGVNLPCHMVIIKNTMSWSDKGLKEYADLEIMQMLGRAGRPQYDTTAVAVIITKQEKLSKYERLVSGEELLESRLHLNLIEHLNAEIGLGTIYDLHTAKRWLSGTFLYIRLGQNPSHYKLDGDAADLNLNDRIERICQRDLDLLRESNLIRSTDGKIRSTEQGDAMARYYLEFETMQLLLHLKPRAKLSDILSAIVQASEFNDVRLRSYEKKLYKEINGANGIKFPIKVDLAMHAHKRSLILQAELGGVEFPANGQYAKHRRQFNQDKTVLFSHIHRLIHCVIDCQIYTQNAVTVRHALELARSFSARVWDNSPYQMKQIAQVGLVAIRRLAVGGIQSIEALEAAEPHQIEMLLSKNPPFGQNLLGNLKAFPKLRVSVRIMSKESRKGRPVTVKIKAECGFLNDKVPMTFRGKSLYICLLTERSDGYLVDFKRTSAKNLANGKDFFMSVELLSHTQYITCYIMCDTVAGTLRYAELKPELPAHLFTLEQQYRPTAATQGKLRQNNSGHRVDHLQTSPVTVEDDEFGENDIEDQDMVDAAAGIEFNNIDSIVMGSYPFRANLSSMRSQKTANTKETPWIPEKLENGRWACNHKCKDKVTCKHMCCRDGVDKAPKPPKGVFVSAASLVDASTLAGRKGADALQRPANKAMSSTTRGKGRPTKTETLDLVGSPTSERRIKDQSREFKNLQRLHESVVRGPATPIITKRKLLNDDTKVDQPQQPVFRVDVVAEPSDSPSTDYESHWIGGLPSPSVLLNKSRGVKRSVSCNETSHNKNQYKIPHPSSPPLGQKATAGPYHVDDSSLEILDLSHPNDIYNNSDLEAAMVGLSDSIAINEDSQTRVTPRVEQQGSALGNGLRTDNKHAPSLNNIPLMDESNVSSKLFLSTDSPEKSMDRYERRTERIDSEGECLSISAPVSKRRRTCSPIDAALQPSSTAANRATAADAMIKPGQPAWVYGFDPAFIAEWQDFVDFV